jgi:glycosyltransferase involved in cell wall biosynthesis
VLNNIQDLVTLKRNREKDSCKVKVLHLFSDWRWTGPAEPVVMLGKKLSERGVDIVLACRKPPVEHPQNLDKKARERGVKVTTQFFLNRYFSPRENLWDIVRLPQYLIREKFDLLHTHLSHDHFLGAVTVMLSRRKRAVPLLRTNHKGVPLNHKQWNRLFLSRYTDHLITISHQAWQGDRQHFGLDPNQVSLVYSGIDPERFQPREKDPRLATSLGLKEGDLVLGIIARMQRRRRFPQFLEAIALALKELPGLKVLIVGRGTYAYEVKDKAQTLGLMNNVIFTGYRDHDYQDVVACMDAKVYLVPGSDGSCRAVMEAMAMAKPIVAACRGVLPELVEDGVTGYLVREDTPENLAHAIVKLLANKDRCHEMGRAARKRILEYFSLDHQADRILEIYQKLVNLH